MPHAGGLIHPGWSYCLRGVRSVTRWPSTLAAIPYFWIQVDDARRFTRFLVLGLNGTLVGYLEILTSLTYYMREDAETQARGFELLIHEGKGRPRVFIADNDRHFSTECSSETANKNPAVV